MRTITTVDYGVAGATADATDFLSHLYVNQQRPTGDELRALFRDLPKDVKRAQSGAVPAPDDPEIESVLREAGYMERTGDWYRAADALSIICQATAHELDLQQIAGSVTVNVAHTPVNGIASHAISNGRHSFAVRLRGEPDTLYSGTETLIRTIFRVGEHLQARDVTCVSKERGADAVFEYLDIGLIRRGGPLSVLRGARREGLVDAVTYLLLVLAVAGFALSWTLHFHPGALGVDGWDPADVSWLDGWIGRLSTSAIFGLVTSVGVLMLTLRRVLAAEDGIYLTFAWRRQR